MVAPSRLSAAARGDGNNRIKQDMKRNMLAHLYAKFVRTYLLVDHNSLA
jgi:hypothetical protein